MISTVVNQVGPSTNSDDSQHKQSDADMEVDIVPQGPGISGVGAVHEPDLETKDVKKSEVDGAVVLDSKPKHPFDEDKKLPAGDSKPDIPSINLAERIARFEPDYKGKERRAAGKEKQPDDKQDRRFHAPYQKQDNRGAKLSKDKRKLTQELGHAQSENRALLRKNEELERELRGAFDALAREQSLREEDLRLLEARAQELRDAQTFLTKADAYSFAEIKGMVEGLNSEVLQIAAMMVDEFSGSGKSMEAGHLTEVGHRLKGILGDWMVERMQDRRDPDMHIEVVQKGIQAVLTYTIQHFISCWSLDDRISDIFVGTYNEIMSTS